MYLLRVSFSLQSNKMTTDKIHVFRIFYVKLLCLVELESDAV